MITKAFTMTTWEKILVILSFITLIIHLICKDIGMAEQISSLAFGIIFTAMLAMITSVNFRADKRDGLLSILISIFAVAAWVTYSGYCGYLTF